MVYSNHDVDEQKKCIIASDYNVLILVDHDTPKKSWYTYINHGSLEHFAYAWTETVKLIF